MKRAISQVLKPYGWIVGLLLIACPSTSPAKGISAGPGRVGAQPVIRITVYNYAHIDRRELREAERQAADLFARAGVRIAWLDFPEKKSPAASASNRLATDFFIRILYASAVRRVRRISGADIMGEAILAPGSGSPVPGRIANVFYDRVRHVSLLWGICSGDILGDAIAHELGHLLGVRHSRRGIMKSDWNLRDLKLAGRGELGFSPSEAALFQRAEVALHHHASLMVLARR